MVEGGRSAKLGRAEGAAAWLWQLAAAKGSGEEDKVSFWGNILEAGERGRGYLGARDDPTRTLPTLGLHGCGFDEGLKHCGLTVSLAGTGT